MDLLCPRCGEPWDVYELHEVEDFTFDQARKRFQAIGCAVFDGGTEPTCEKVENLSTLASATLMDLMGDDVDGAASLLDDFGFLGMLDD